MAQNKLAMHSRSHYQQRRDVRRVKSINDFVAAPADNSPEPSRQAVDRDLLSRAYELMDPEVRQMADCRVQGAKWGDIAAQLGGTADARRKQFLRHGPHRRNTRNRMIPLLYKKSSHRGHRVHRCGKQFVESE